MQKEAKKEGKVILYTTVGSDVRLALAKALKKYDIALESIAGPPVQIIEKILKERKAGIYNVDFLHKGGLTTHLPLKDAGALAYLESLFVLPEVKDPGKWYKGELPFADKEKMMVAFVAVIDEGIHINSNMVKPEDIKSMHDLLAPRWKGKIIMYNTAVLGRGQKWMAVIALHFGEEYIRQLAKQEPFITRDYRQLVDWVVMGKNAIGIGVRASEYLSYKREGAPITHITIDEISYLEGGLGHLSYFNRAPNPNASRFFLNWFLSKEGQTLWQQASGDQSARTDIAVDHLIKEGIPVRKPGVDYYDVRYERWEAETRTKGDKINMEVFRPLIR